MAVVGAAVARGRGAVVARERGVTGTGATPPVPATRPRAPINEPAAVTAHTVAMEGAGPALPADGSNVTSTGAETAVMPVTSTGTHASAITRPTVGTATL